jgi:hypothetical protein
MRCVSCVDSLLLYHPNGLIRKRTDNLWDNVNLNTTYYNHIIGRDGGTAEVTMPIPRERGTTVSESLCDEVVTTLYGRTPVKDEWGYIKFRIFYQQLTL